MIKNNALQYTKHGNSSHPQVSKHYHTNKTISNSQTWHSPNTWLQRSSHKDDNHYANWLHFYHAVSLSSYNRDQWSEKKFNTAAIWAVVTTSSPIHDYISNISSSWCNLMRFLSSMHTSKKLLFLLVSTCGLALIIYLFLA